MAKIVKLIQTEELIGNGTEEKPYSRIRTLWSESGEMVAEMKRDLTHNQWYVRDYYGANINYGNKKNDMEAVK